MYRVARDGELAETSVYLRRDTVYHNDASSSVPDFVALDDLFLGTLPVPDLDGFVLTVHIGPYTIEYIESFEDIESHKRDPGKVSLANFNAIFSLRISHPISAFGDTSTMCLNAMEMIRVYRSRVLAEDPHAFDPPKSTTSKRDVVAQSS